MKRAFLLLAALLLACLAACAPVSEEKQYRRDCAASATAYMKEREWIEDRPENYVNLENPEVEIVSRIPGVFIAITQDYAKDGERFAIVTFHREFEGLRGPMILMLDENCVVFGAGISD